MSEIRQARNRYELLVDGNVIAVSTYRDAGNRRIFLHTEVDPDYEHHGYATELVRWALEDVRSTGMRIVAQCPMVAAYVGKHREFDDILDSPEGVEG